MYGHGLAGTPDLVFDNAKLLVLVHDCFWHGCQNCYRRPHFSRSYWDEKVRRNRARDSSVTRTLRKAGWKVVKIWECELSAKKSRRTVGRIKRALQRSSAKLKRRKENDSNRERETPALPGKV